MHEGVTSKGGTRHQRDADRTLTAHQCCMRHLSVPVRPASLFVEGRQRVPTRKARLLGFLLAQSKALGLLRQVIYSRAAAPVF